MYILLNESIVILKMKIAIVWCSIYLDKPIRGVCIEYLDGKEIDEQSGLPRGKIRFFNIEDYYKDTYCLYSLPEDDMKFLESERKLTESVLGRNINHDKRFSFVSDGVCRKNMTLQHYMAPLDSKIGNFHFSDIKNAKPFEVNRGLEFP